MYWRFTRDIQTTLWYLDATEDALGTLNLDMHNWEHEALNQFSSIFKQNLFQPRVRIQATKVWLLNNSPIEADFDRVFMEIAWSFPLRVSHGVFCVDITDIVITVYWTIPTCPISTTYRVKPTNELGELASTLIRSVFVHKVHWWDLKGLFPSIAYNVMSRLGSSETQWILFRTAQHPRQSTGFCKSRV